MLAGNACKHNQINKTIDESQEYLPLKKNQFLDDVYIDLKTASHHWKLIEHFLNVISICTILRQGGSKLKVKMTTNSATSMKKNNLN